MGVNRVKTVAAMVLALGILGTGAGMWLGRTPAGSEPPGTDPDESGALVAQGTRSAGRQGGPAARPDPEGKAAAQSRANLRQIAIALHNFHDTYSAFPNPALFGRDGKPLLSWRVALLPYLGEADLYKQFRLNEPWDSPHNKKLLAKMPAVYRIPAVQPKDMTSTYYQVFVGNSAAFEVRRAGAGGSGDMMGSMGGYGPGMMPPGGGGEAAGSADAGGPAGGRPRRMRGPGMESAAGGMMSPGLGAAAGSPDGMGAGMPAAPSWLGGTRITNITDGTSNTLLVIEGDTAVPWTKPEDLAYSPIARLPRLGGPFEHVFHAAFADGSVHAISKDVDERLLRLAITRDDGLPYDRDELVDPITTTDVDELRRENRRLEMRIQQVEAYLNSLRQQIRRENLRLSLREEEAGLVETLQREQKQLRREADRLSGEARKLRTDLERLRQGKAKEGQRR